MVEQRSSPPTEGREGATDVPRLEESDGCAQAQADEKTEGQVEVK